MNRPKWDCLTKEIWKKAYRIMRTNCSSDFLIQIKMEHKCFNLLMEVFSEYSARIRYLLADYYFKYFHIPL